MAYPNIAYIARHRTWKPVYDPIIWTPTFIRESWEASREHPLDGMLNSTVCLRADGSGEIPPLLLTRLGEVIVHVRRVSGEYYFC